MEKIIDKTNGPLEDNLATVDPLPESMNETVIDNAQIIETKNEALKQIDKDTITIRSAVNPTSETVIRIFSAAPIITKSTKTPSNVKTVYDPKSGDLLIYIKRSKSMETKNERSVPTRPEFIRRMHSFGYPIQFASRDGYDKSVLKASTQREMTNRKTSEFETIQEVSIEDDDFHVTPNQDNKRNDEDALQIFDSNAKEDQNYSLSERTENHFRSISTHRIKNYSFPSLNDQHKKILNDLNKKKEPERKPTSIKSHITRIRLKKSNSIKPREFNPLKAHLKRNNEKKTFYITKTRLIGQITEKTKPRIECSKLNDKQIIPSKETKSYLYNGHLETSFASPVLIEYDNETNNSNLGINESRSSIHRLKRQAEYSMNVHQSSSKSKIGKTMFLAEGREMIPSRYKSRNKSIEYSTNFSKKRALRNLSKNDNLALTLSKAQKYWPQKMIQSISAGSDEEEDYYHTIGSVLRNKNGKILISPVPENQNNSLEIRNDENITEQSSYLKDKLEMNKSKLSINGKKSAESENSEASICCCYYCESETDTETETETESKSPNKFCKFQRCLMILIIVFIIMIVSALIGTIVYFAVTS